MDGVAAVCYIAAMRTRLLAGLLVIVIGAVGAIGATAHADEPPRADAQADAARIAGAILVGGQALNLVEELGDRFGARLTGSPAYQRSAEWTAQQLRGWGLAVKLEPFTVGATWQRGGARARVVKPFEAPLHVEAAGWSAPTPKGGVRGELLVLKEVDPEALAKLSPKGKIVLFMRSGRTPGAPPNPKAYGAYLRAREALAQSGAVALLSASPDSAPNNVVATGGSGPHGTLTKLPTANVGYEDAQMLARRAEKAPLVVELELSTRGGPAGNVPNVIAELKGERSDEWVLVGAHLDSWDFATGSQDNGAGVAQVLEAARVLAKMGRPPRRSIRFALWGGEEQGLLGAVAYVKAHEGELAGCVAALNTDNGAGHPEGWKVQGRDDVKAGLTPIAKSLLAGLGAAKVADERTFDTDHAAFYIAGVPALDLLVDEGNYRTVHHKVGDTFDKIDPHNLAAGAAVVAITAWAIADAPERVAPKLDHAAMEKILEEAGTLEMLKRFGMWK